MLTLNLLQEHLDKEIVLSGPRYTPGQDIKAPNLPIHTLLKGIDFLVRSKELHRQLCEFLEKFNTYFINNEHKVCNLFKDQIYNPAIVKKYVSKLISLDLVTNFDELDDLRKGTEDIFSIFENRKLELQRERENAVTEFACRDNLIQELYWINGTLKTLLDLIKLISQEPFQLINSPYLFINGVAGSGKTHFLCDLTKNRLAKSYPTLLVLGQKFRVANEHFL
jgi:hypothetical protein